MTIRRVGVLSLLTLTLAVTPAFALTASWNPNAETDMKEYGVYMCKVKGCAVQRIPEQQVAVVPHVNGTARPTWVLPNQLEGTLAVTARDTSGNESELSNQVPFDSLAPKVPTDASVGK